MGIIRYPIECPGCSAKIILRLTVGHDNQQPFFYVCPQCRAATRGALHWDGNAHTSLHLADGRLLNTEAGCNFTLSINPEYPAVIGAKGLEEPNGSAFLMFAQLLGLKQLETFQI